MLKYTMEKVLYFADGEKGLHVSITEPSHSDLSERVQKCLERYWIVQVAQDDSGWYFKTTLKGTLALIDLQIEWRKRNGKSIENLLERKSFLKMCEVGE